MRLAGRFSIFAVSGGALFALYYWTYMICKVSIQSTKNERNKNILQRCSLLLGSYWPNLFVISSHLQGVFLMKLRVNVDPCYRREVLKAEDGATLLLDWGESDGPSLRNNSPIVCLLSGTTGNSKSSYITYLMKAMRKRGWRPVTMNYPGLTEDKMTSPRFFCIDSVSDIRQFVDHVHACYPEAPIMGVGFSIGGHFFLKYLQEVSNSPMCAVVTLSAPFSTRKCDEFWKGKWVNENVYDRHFLDKFKGGILKNEEIFAKVDYIDLQSIYKAKNMYELHLSFTVPLSKLKTLEEYYHINESESKMANIQIPTLILHAWNDPVVPPSAVPVEAINENPFTILATTKSGGHTGWLCGINPFTGLSWGEKVVLQYLEAIMDLRKENKL